MTYYLVNALRQRDQYTADRVAFSPESFVEVRPGPHHRLRVLDRHGDWWYCSGIEQYDEDDQHTDR